MESVKKMTELPKITVVTPSFNQGKYLRDTIESVLNQNYPNLEYFIIDDGSTDNTIQIIREYENQIDWWISAKDQGQADAIKKGFDRASGKLLGWLNSDDIFFPGALRMIGEAYVKSPHASLYVGGIAIGKYNTNIIRKCTLPIQPDIFFSKYGLFAFPQQSLFFEEEIYRKVGGLNKNLYIRMDGDIIFRIMREKHSAVIINELLGFFRLHGDTKTSLAKERYYEERRNFLKIIGLSRFTYNIIEIFYKITKIFYGFYWRNYVKNRGYRTRKIADIWLDSQKKSIRD